MPTHVDLTNARNNRADEFYTRLCDIENELLHSEYNFRNKVVLCNRDGPCSMFVRFFIEHFESLGIKELYATCYSDRRKGTLIQYNGIEQTIEDLEGNGDFASDECIHYLKLADVVCTNPPFSLFTKFVKLMFDCQKDFIIVGNQVAISNPLIFDKMKNDKLWFGYGFKGLAGYFMCPDDYENYATSGQRKENLIRVAGVTWYTTLKPNIRNKEFEFEVDYDKDKYETYDDFDDIIEVGSCKDIPDKYYGLMVVPITFINKYCPDQFELIGSDKDITESKYLKGSRFRVNGKSKFARIVIRRKEKK